MPGNVYGSRIVPTDFLVITFVREASTDVIKFLHVTQTGRASGDYHVVLVTQETKLKPICTTVVHHKR